jgi:hypothetical protein
LPIFSLQTLNLKEFQNPLLENLARIKACLWLGLTENSQVIFETLKHSFKIPDACKNKPPTFLLQKGII